MRRIEQIRGIKKSKLNRMDYLNRIMKADRTGEVRETVKQLLAETDKKSEDQERG